MNPKRLKANISLSDFFADAQSCMGTVYFVTEDGDQLNMKTTLSQFLFSTTVSNSTEPIEGKIHCSVERDYERLAKYLEN